MATHLRESISVDAIIEHCDAIAAALESDPEAAPLAATWQALTAKADALGGEQRALEREDRRARARARVIDTRWDRECAAFGRAVVDAAGGQRDTALYARFFGKMPPSAAQTLGIEREIALGERFVAELGREPGSPLTTAFAARIEAATSALRSARDTRTAALRGLAQHRTSIVLLVDDVNRELDRTEGELLKLFPGDRARVGSYLATTRPSRRDPAAAGDAQDPLETSS